MKDLMLKSTLLWNETTELTFAEIQLSVDWMVKRVKMLVIITLLVCQLSSDLRSKRTKQVSPESQIWPMGKYGNIAKD